MALSCHKVHRGWGVAVRWRGGGPRRDTAASTRGPGAMRGTWLARGGVQPAAVREAGRDPRPALFLELDTWFKTRVRGGGPRPLTHFPRWVHT